MINFVYTAKNTESGQLVKAEVQAENAQSAAKLLMAQNLFPISIENKDERKLAGGFKIGTGVSTKDRVVFTRQLATLINAGLPLTQSLRTVREQITNKSLKSVVSAIVASVEGGSSLANAFGQHPKVFNQVYISLISAGESSGTLDKTMDRIASQQEKDAAIASKIRGAMVYPAIVLFVIGAVLVFMLTTVLPQVGKLYKDLHKELPLLTKILVGMSDFLINYWYISIGLLVLVIFGLRMLFKTAWGQDFIDGFKLNMPLIGRLFKKVYMARYARTLGTLLGSGIPMLEGLSIVKNAVSNGRLEASIQKSMDQVRGGKALSATIENDPNFLILVPQMIRIGEQAGAIDDMLNRVAVFYENEVDEEVKNISTTIEPILMVVMGVMVGGIIAAILLPIYSLVGTGIT